MNTDELIRDYKLYTQLNKAYSITDFSKQIELLQHQIIPEGPWRTYLMMAGRGAGKTQAGSYWVNKHCQGEKCISRGDQPHRGLIVAPSVSEAVDSTWVSPSGIKSLNPDVRMKEEKHGLVINWHNGSQVKIMGAMTVTDIERFRSAGNTCFVWAEEFAAWRLLEEAYAQIQLGLRIGKAQMLITTTPKPRKQLIKLVEEAKTNPKIIVRTGVSMSDNPYLHSDIKSVITQQYAGTRLGHQEILGELVFDVEGALFNIDNISANRREIDISELPLIVVGVDPAATAGENADDTGIIIAGKKDKHIYILGDYTINALPDKWGQAVVDAYHEHKADMVVAETNQGGDMVEFLIKQMDPSIKIKNVRATRGKQLRAQPVSALYARGYVHHVGIFDKLEDQMTNWVPGNAESPDRLDALVWAVYGLGMIGGDWTVMYDDMKPIPRNGMFR